MFCVLQCITFLLCITNIMHVLIPTICIKRKFYLLRLFHYFFPNWVIECRLFVINFIHKRKDCQGIGSKFVLWRKCTYTRAWIVFSNLYTYRGCNRVDKGCVWLVFWKDLRIKQYSYQQHIAYVLNHRCYNSWGYEH